MTEIELLAKRISAAAMARLDWRWAASGSAYASVAPTAGDWGATIRVSDHRQKVGGGFNEATGERNGDAGLDFWFDGQWHAFVGFNRSGKTVHFNSTPSAAEIWDLLRDLRDSHL